MDNILAPFHKSFMVIPHEYQFNVQDKIEFSHFNVYHSQDLSTFQITIDGIKILLLGHFVHTKKSDLNYSEIFTRLLSYSIDSTQFLEEMSYFNGRYGIFIEKDDNLYFYNDATSFLSMYYHSEKSIYASHSELVQQLLQHVYNMTSNRIAYKSNGFLDYSKYEHIYKFNSNTRFDLTHHKVKRIFPINAYQKKSAEAVLSLIYDEMVASVNALFRFDKDIVCSITAGHDSRVSLSFLKNYLDKVKFFTYTKDLEMIQNEQAMKIYQVDEAAIKQIADNLNLNHTLFNMDAYDLAEEVKRDYERYETSHGIQLINYYHYDYDFQNVIHLKSTIFELAKAIIPKSIHSQDDFLPYAQFIKRWAKDFSFENGDVQDYLSDFIKRNEIEKAIALGYHPFEMLYYEARMNGWHSAIIQESDPYLDVFSLINSRHILFELLNIQPEDKSVNKLHKLIIQKNWPILNYFQVNSTKTLEDYIIELENQNKPDKQDKGNLTIETKDFYQVQQEKGLRFRSLSHAFSSETKKVLYLTNKTNQILNIEIKTFYKNKQGKGFIYFEFDNRVVDLVDLSNEGFVIKINPESTQSISIYASKNFEKASWTTASEFELIEK